MMFFISALGKVPGKVPYMIKLVSWHLASWAGTNLGSTAKRSDLLMNCYSKCDFFVTSKATPLPGPWQHDFKPYARQHNYSTPPAMPSRGALPSPARNLPGTAAGVWGGQGERKFSNPSKA